LAVKEHTRLRDLHYLENWNSFLPQKKTLEKIDDIQIVLYSQTWLNDHLWTTATC
jgi:hypothetical protein